MTTTLYPLDYPELAAKALDGGFIQALDGSIPTTGYAVSDRPYAERHVYVTSIFDPTGRRNTRGGAERIVADALYRFAIDHGHALRTSHLLGAWRETSSHGDRVVIYLVRVVGTFGEAQRVGLAAHQRAIYDLDRGEDIAVNPYYGREHQLDDHEEDR